MPKLERILIPADALQAKPWFKTREEADAVVQEIQNHVALTGQTYSWRGHTHSKPPVGAIPVYIGEFALPTKARKAGRFAPCPCCSREFAKFGHGMIAWFPEESVIRLVGPHCFRALDPEAHKTAKENYEREKAIKKDHDFLLGKIDKLPEVLRLARKAVDVAKAVEVFHRSLHQRFRTFDLDLWRLASDGGLPVRVQSKEFRHRRSGGTDLVETERYEVRYRLRGFKMLDASPKSLSRPLEKCISAIEAYDFGKDWRYRVEAMTVEERHAAVAIIGKGTQKISLILRDVADLRQFATPLAINTLKSWAEDEWCPTRVHFRINENRIWVGKYSHSALFVEIPADIRADLADIDFFTNLVRVESKLKAAS